MRFTSLVGAMASMGRSGGVMQLKNSDLAPSGPNLTGFAAYLAWTEPRL